MAMTKLEADTKTVHLARACFSFRVCSHLVLARVIGMNLRTSLD